MAGAAQAIFKKICLHNKLLDEATIDNLFSQVADPEKGLKLLVDQGVLPLKVAKKVQILYRKQIERHVASHSKSGSKVHKSSSASGVQIQASEPKDLATAEEIASAALGEDSPEAIAAAALAEDSPEAVAAAALTEESPDAPGAAALSDPALDTIVEPASTMTVPEAIADAPGDSTSDAITEEDLDDLFADIETKPAPESIAKPVATAPATAVTPPAAETIEPPAPAPKPKAPAPSSPAATAPKPKAPLQPAAEVDDTPAGSVKDYPEIAETLRQAIKLGASDVHITAGRPPVVRIANELRELELPAMAPDKCRSALVALLTPDRRRQFNEIQDLDFCYDGGTEFGRFRTNYFIEQGGMDAVFRLITEKVPTMEELNLPEQIARLTDATVGIVLVTGPKSAGKTTTLAAMIDSLNSTRQDHILTIEDPIEFVHPIKQAHITQREVGTHTESFRNALKGAMREAPDVIMVGEMRDLETTSLVVTAAETGFLVFATLHTPDAIRTIGRVLGVFPAKEQAQIRSMLAKSLRGIVSQQLVPRIDGKGLELAVEVLVNTPAISNLIRENRTFQLPSLMQVGGKLGMVMMDDSLIRLAKEGKIPKEEAVKRASDLKKVCKDLDMKVERGMSEDE